MVSIITPTYGRVDRLPLLWEAIQSQIWPRLEWLVEDDSPQPSQFMQSIADSRVHYVHDPTRRSIGEKRNRLIARAEGEYIAHFDDDDYYAPQYLQQMVLALETGHADLCKLSGFFLFYSVSGDLAYWNLLEKTGIHFKWAGNSLQPILVTEQNNAELLQMHMGFGFSYVYRRSVWSTIQFPDQDLHEDLHFILATEKTKHVLLLPDTSGLCLHILHGGNSSRCFPQYVLPPFMAESIFPAATPYLKRV